MSTQNANRLQRQNLGAILEDARRNMQQKLTASETAANDAFAKVKIGTAQGNRHAFANVHGNMLAAGAVTMNRPTQGTQTTIYHFARTEHVPHVQHRRRRSTDTVNCSANDLQNSTYQLRPGTSAPQSAYRDSFMMNPPRMQPKQTMPQSSQSLIATPFEPKATRRFEKRHLEAFEPDPEDSDTLRWESWALRQLIKDKLNIDDDDIKAFLREEFQSAIERKHMREGLEKMELKQEWDAYMTDRHKEQHGSDVHVMDGGLALLQY